MQVPTGIPFSFNLNLTSELSIFKAPDPNLKFNEATKHYDYSPIDWDEFWNVVKGNGAGNKLRLKHHIKAHEDGKWVREAAKSYAQKQNLIQKSA